MEQAYSILYNHLSFSHILSLLIVFIATLLIWHLIAKKTCGNEKKTCGNEKKTCGNEKKTCGNEKKSLTHSILISLFVTYIFFILLITLIARTPAINPDGTLNHKIKLIPFWSWYEVIVNHSRGLLVEIILNVVLFMPVGILGRLLGRSLNISFRRIFGLSLFLSLAIELTQYFTCLGLCEIFDDVIGNTVGGVIGWYIGGVVKRVWSSRRVKIEKS